MTETELIAKQALEIATQKELISDLVQRLSDIRKMLICVGGPLNDNALKYSKEQALIFFKIEELTTIKL